MRKTLYLLLFACCLGYTLLSSPVRSNLGGVAPAYDDNFTLSAADYRGFADNWFQYDGIENADLGIHADTLSLWRNIAPRSAELPYDTDLALRDMGIEPCAMSADTASSHAFAYISSTDFLDILDPAAYTVEVAFSFDELQSSGSSSWIVFSGYNGFYFSPDYQGTGDGRLRTVSTRADHTMATEQFYGFTVAPGFHTMAFTQNGRVISLYIDGTLIGKKTIPADPEYLFFQDSIFVNKARYNGIGNTTAKYYSIRVCPRVLSEADLIFNHLVDNLRFNISQ